MKSTNLRWLALLPIFLLAFTCPLLNLWSEKHESTTNASPQLTTPCIVLTGEHLYPVEMVRRPPATVHPGDTVTITFTGGYMLMPTCEKRDGKEYYHYPTMQELSEINWRTAIAQLDEKDLASIRCGHECQINFVLPAETKIGQHTLTVLTGGSPFFNPKDTTYTIDVIEP